MSKIKLIIVAGPTASGKSDLAVLLAQRFGGEIISADSRQVYRGMDIGTGKVSRVQQRAVPHHMLDVASPKRQYTVAKYKKAATKAIADIARRGKLPIVCGGTGFWIDTLVYDLSLPEVKPNPKLRRQLSKLPLSELLRRLKKLDPERAATIDRHNPVRLIRALEIVLTTGSPVPPLEKMSGSEAIPGSSSREPSPGPYEPLYLGISLPKEKLSRRIALRLDARLKAGMVDEVRHLHTSGVSWKKLEAFGLEYRGVARFLQKQISRKELRDGLLRDIIAYSRRQLTWWRRNKDVRWVSGRQAQAIRLVGSFL